MALIQYVGLKPLKKDNVAGTGLEWAPGEFHDVADPKKVALLLAHPDVWAVLDREAIAAKAARIREEEEAMRERRAQVERELAEADERLRLAEIAAVEAAQRADDAEKKVADTGLSSASAPSPVPAPAAAKAPADMEVEDLRAHCASLGWEGHPLTGKAKLLAWLQEQAK